MSIEDQVGFLSGYAMVFTPGFVYPQEIQEQLEQLQWSPPVETQEALNG